MAKETGKSAYTVSLAYDRRLYRRDVAGSVAHARMLAKQGIIAENDAELSVIGLGAIRQEIEAPAATVLHAAHRALESITLGRDQLRLKEKIAQEYAELVYNGLWYTGFHQDLDAYVQSTQRYVTGTIRLRLFKGSCTVVGRNSPYSLYEHDLATYDVGDRFDHRSSEGFIHIYGLAGRTQARVQPLDLPELHDSRVTNSANELLRPRLVDGQQTVHDG